MNLIKHNKYPYVVGDRVVLLTLALGNSYLWNVVNTDECMIEISQIGQKNDWVHFLEIKHATPEEIKAGHRIDDNTEDVTDIRNHLSPITVVVDL